MPTIIYYPNPSEIVDSNNTTITQPLQITRDSDGIVSESLPDITLFTNAAALLAQPQYQWVTYCTLKNGVKLQSYFDHTYTYSGSNYIDYQIRILDYNNNYFAGWGTSFRYDGSHMNMKVGFLFLQSDNQVLLFNGTDNYRQYCITQSPEAQSGLTVAELLEGTAPILYIWHARDQIAGNGGQYRCDLTKLLDASIGDFTTIRTGDSSNFSRISPQSSLWNIYHNMAFDETRKVAWSGANYMTMTLNELPSYPTQHSFTFKFYNIVTVGGEQVPSLIWQDEFPITITGQNTDIDFYLSFVYDANEEVAIFLPITKDLTGAYKWGWSGGLPTEVTMHNMYTWLMGSSNPGNVTPYSTGTEDNGGTPGGSLPQSHIDVPTAPALGAMTSGMFTLYCPTDTELEHIAAFLWTDDVIQNILKYFNNFSDNIMALYVLPCKPANNPTKAFQVGNMISDDVSLAAVEYIDDRFITIDMGDITDLKPYWGSYLDYAPYSSLQVVLPGIGVQTLDVDDIFCPADADGNLPAPDKTTIHLDYTIDLMTGVLVAFVSINGEVRYQFPGKVGYQIPLTGENYVRMAQGFIAAAAGLIGTIASQGTAAPFAGSAAAAGIINAMKPDVYRGGNLSGDASMLARLTPTLIYRRPNKPLLEGQEDFTGFPSYKIGKLSDFSGYTEVLDAHVEGISCTEEEREKILAALKGGVII